VYHPVVIPLRRAFVAASLGWTAALPLATWFASRPANALPGYAFALTVYGIGALICHQRPERSFWMWSAQMPVCARCAGIYLGAAVVGAAATIAAPRGPWDRTTPVRDARRLRALFLAAALPTAATLVFEWTTGQTPSNVVRAAAGLPLGGVVAWIVARSG
jgi:uncharacterized membrane protein